MADTTSSDRNAEGPGSDTERLLPHGSESAAESGDMGSERVRPEGRLGDNWARTLTLIGALVLVITTWSLIIRSGPYNLGWFAFHPPLQTLAIALFAYGIVTLQPTSQPVTKAAGFVRHQTAMLFLGFPVIVLGTSAIVYNKYVHGAEHATTWHGTFGFVCIAWLFFQIFLGLGSVKNDGALFGGGARAKAVWKYHRASGYILFPLMLFTAHLGGGWSTWAVGHAGSFVRVSAYFVAPVLIFTGIYVRIRFSKMKFY